MGSLANLNPPVSPTRSTFTLSSGNMLSNCTFAVCDVRHNSKKYFLFISGKMGGVCASPIIHNCTNIPIRPLLRKGIDGGVKWFSVLR